MTLSDHGVVKGHCSFTVLPNLVQGSPRHIDCNNEDLIDLFEALLQTQVTSTPRGKVTLTPSGNVNVNCHNVATGGN